MRWATKPVELRALTASNQATPRGMLQCFVDIMRPEEALAFAPEDVSLPPRQMFEVRGVWLTSLT